MEDWEPENAYVGGLVNGSCLKVIELYREAVLWMEQAVTEINKPFPDYCILQGFTERVTTLSHKLYTEGDSDDRQEDIHEVFKAVKRINERLKESLIDAFQSNDHCDSTSLMESTHLGNTSFGKSTQQQDSTSCTDEAHSSARQQAICDSIVLKTSVTFDEVIGLTEAKKSLNEAIIMPLLYPQLFVGKRKPWTRILLYGPPGTGKSRLAHAVANKIDSSFYAISSSDILSSFFGQSEKMIRDLFKHARSVEARSVIFMDEIDSLCRRRSDKEEEAVRRIKTELLHNMDGLEDNGSLFVLCATNCPWEIDPAFLRRFQKRVYIPLPDVTSRVDIMKLHTGDDCDLSDSDWLKLGEMTEGYSGSDLATLVNAALFQPVRELQHTTRWSQISNHKYRPCPPDVVPEVMCAFEQLRPTSVLTRDVSVDDFESCIGRNKATVSDEDLIKFEDFTNRFGLMGS